MHSNILISDQELQELSVMAPVFLLVMLFDDVERGSSYVFLVLLVPCARLSKDARKHMPQPTISRAVYASVSRTSGACSHC